MTMPVIKENNKENICCPNFRVLECADTQEHRHLICGYSNIPISNETTRNLCIGLGFKECINMTIEAS